MKQELNTLTGRWIHSRNRHSIFLKLIGIFLLAGLLLNLLGFAFFRLGKAWQEENQLENTVLYLLESTIVRMGEPPTVDEAQNLLRSHGLALAFSTDENAIRPSPSSPGMRDLDGQPSATVEKEFNLLPFDMEFDEDFFSDSGNELDIHRGKLMARIHRAEGTYWIQYSLGEMDHGAWGILGFLISLSTVMLLTYYLMRKTLKPLKHLMTGVQETSRGNLDYRIEVHRKDELGKLASVYNEMQEKIQSMLESRRQLLLDVSHEIRTPLTRMKLSLEFIPSSNRTAALKEEIELLDTMLTEVLENERLSSLHGALQKENLNLASTLKKSIQRFQAAGFPIQQQLPDLRLNHDPARLGIAIQNLLENAIRHTDPEDRKISITLIPEGSGARILVQDNGGGIPDSERNSIFEPFYRRPSSSRGFGLGLSLVHRIIESHEGTIELDSSGSAGTTFIIWLPGTDSRGQKPGTES